MTESPSELQLNDRWTVIGPIGDDPGMSEVFEVVHDGVYAVVKKIKKLPGAERELLVADLGDCRNIVPFDEVVETDSEILIRMPKAERSLNQHLEAAGGPLRETEVIAVLTDLATALSDCGRIVVHRDIKPQNALLLGVHWCLSDFGIARYAEAATASQTRKGWRSPPWTAPERWEGKRATIKSDIYSLGVVAYQMATGQLPFQGPDFHEQHREQHPTPPSGVSPLLRALIAEMLAKSPDARPTPEQLLERLAAVAKPASSSAVARLQGLAAQRVEHIANDDADPARAVLEREQRDLLGQSGRSMLRDLVEPLGESLAALPGLDTGSVGVGRDAGSYFSLGQARIAVTEPHQVARHPQLPFDVVLYASIAVAMLNTEPTQWGGRCHSLWYCDAQFEGEYHWFETAFHNIGASGSNAGVRNIGQKRIQMEPYDRSPTDGDAIYAISPVMHTEQVARAFLALVGDAADSFVERWLSWFADAAEGKLAQPMVMPEGSTLGSWRR